MERKHFSDRTRDYEDDRIVDKGKIHWADDDFVVINEWVLQDVITSDEVLPYDVWSWFVRCRDNFTCGMCQKMLDSQRSGFRVSGKGGGLAAHHVVYLRDGGKNIMSNGETLRWSCHTKTHGNRIGTRKINGLWTKATGMI